MKLKFIKRVLMVAVIGFVTNTSNAQSLTLSKIGGYSTGIYNAGGCEIVTYDATSKRLFSVNASTGDVDIISLANPTSPSLIASIDLSAFGSSANSVSCKNGVVAIAVEDFVKQNNGKVVFMDTLGTILNNVTVGALPDMVTFTPDGLNVLVANEGEPNDSYTIDPVGSVSIIDISGGIAGLVQGNVTTLDFSAFNTPFVLDPSIRVFGPGATVAMDFEPEYITVSANSQTAWITLQENNAVAILDIPSATFTSVKGLGFKDHSIAGNGLGASDQGGVVNIATWPIKGMYLPDGIASYVVGGNQYIVTANEGDTRAYTGFNEEARISTRTLDATAFPTGATLKLNTNLGRLGTSTIMGDTDNDLDIDVLYSVGARSITIRDAAGNLVWDSGDKIEQVTALAYPANFNASNTANTFKNRSDDKGPEPEGVAIGQIGDSTYAFVGLERIGGVMVFNITNPATSYYVTYINSRNFAQTPGVNQGGDLGAEGIIFIPAAQSPNGKNLVVTGNEISGTVAVFEVNLFPEINLLGNATTIVDGDNTAILTDHTDFGKTTIGSSITRTFTISNSGLGALTVNNIALGGDASYSFVGLPTLPLTVASNGTQTFQVQFTPTATGVFASTVTITSNDGDESTYDFVLSGTGLVLPVTGPSSSQSPYVLPSQPGVKTTSILTVGDAAANGYIMCGIPDGTGAYDNGNGTFTLLVNHEFGNTAGVVRAHGSTGAFVSKWIINKSNFSVLSGSDLITTVNLWNGSGFTAATTQFNRFCSADLPEVSAFYNSVSGKGTQERIFMNGEESGAEGRAFGHIATGPNAGTTYQLPYLGRFSWENSLASPYMSDKTIVAGTDDATPGQVYVYIGTKTNTGTEIDKAGLNNGKLFGIKVTGLGTEVNATNLVAAPFTMADLGFVQNTTGAALQTASVTAGVTSFLRPEDAHWDPKNPNVLYFLTTNSITAPSKLWKVVFTDINNPELGGTITSVLDGTEGQKMLDNMTVDNHGFALLQEDVGNNVHIGKIHQYTVATDQIKIVAEHDANRFILGAPNYLTQDEEASGIIDASSFLGSGNFLMVDQAHYAQPGQLVEGGQILALYNPDSYLASAEVSVTGNSVNIVDGDATASTVDHTDFANVFVGSTLTRTYTINNAGPSSLTVSGVSLSGSAVFTLVGAPTFPLTIISGGSQTIQVQFAPTTSAVANATLTIANNDDDESTFDFAIKGTGLVLPVTGPSSSQSPYVLPSQPGVKTTSILTVGDAAANGYIMCGIPDGTGAYDNGNGTFTLLVNHEFGNTAGVVRAHGSTGAFVSKWIINKSNFSVLSGSDLITTVNLWNGSGFTAATTQFNRFCSADLPEVSAFYNSVSGKGTQERIFMNGEESGAEGRAFGHIATGPNAGTTYQLPYLGRFSWENSLASPYMSDKTIVAGTDDATPGQVYVYIGTKTNTGNEIEKAGLNNGKLFGIAVSGLAIELSATNLVAAPFTMADLGFVQNTTGAALQTASVTAGVTQFLRPEDAHWDPSNPNVLYFVTTNNVTSPSKLWKVVFTDINNPELGGTITSVLDGTEGQKMLDNMTVDSYGHALLQEDVGNNVHIGKIHQYTIATDQLLTIAEHDANRFILGAPNYLTQDEEASGIIEASFLGAGNFLMVDQAHYAQPGQLVEGGQILALFNPATAAGCVPTTSTTSITACDTYAWNGTTYTTSGTYTYSTLNVQGCDSTATLILTINNSSSSTSTLTACDSLAWNGTTYTASGVYTFTTTNAAGCDSIATLNLTINNSSTSSTAITACDSYVWNGTTYTTSGVYTFTTTNAAGCDSIATLNLTINSIASYFVSAGVDQNVCANANVSLNGSISGGVSNATWSTTGTGTFSPSANVLNATYIPSTTDYTNGSVTLVLTTNSVSPCGSKSDTVVVTFIALPASPASLTGPNALCNPSTGAVFTYTATPVVGATSYSWTVPAGVTIQGSATGSSINVKFNASSVLGGIGGSICVSANNANGCGNSAPTCLAISVQTSAPVQPNSISGTTKACPGDVAVYSVAPVSKATNYIWTIPANTTITAGAGTNVITLSFGAGFTSGNISVAASNVCGTSALRSRSILPNILPAPASISGVQFDGVCGATVTYTANVAGATSYVWTLPAGATGSSTTNSIEVTFTNSFTTGTISVAGVNGCGAGNVRNVTVKGAPGLPGVISGPTPICASSTNTYAIAVVQGATSYDWTVPTGVINFGQGTKTINMTYGSAVSPSGLITVKAVNACGTSSTRILSVETLYCPRMGDATSASGVTIYPNPANENLTVEFIADKAQNATITLSDATGRVVYTAAKEVSEGFNNAKINVKGFASGIYTLQLQSINGTQQFKVIVE